MDNSNRNIIVENIALRTALSNLVVDLDRALASPVYGAQHLRETKYFVEARTLLGLH